MARHGENIRKRKDGRWEGRCLLYNKEKGKQRYRSVYGRTYEEAREKLAVLRNRQKESAKLADGKGGKEKNPNESPETNPAAEGITKENRLFTYTAEEWLLQVKATRKPSTYVKYRLIYKNYLKSVFQDAAIVEITDCCVQEKISDPLSESIRKSIYCVLNRVLKFASRNYSITMPFLKRPISHTPKKPVETFSRKEQAKLLLELNNGCESDRYKAAILLCLHTGMRLGELCALKWEDLDTDSQMIAVNRTVQRLYLEDVQETDGWQNADNLQKAGAGQRKTILVETTPKSAHSKREIPLSPTVLALINQLQQNHEQGKGEKAYIFGGDKPMEPRTIQNHFRKVLTSAGIKYKNFHVLRHTFSTNCIEGGTDVKSLSELLGHSDVQITLNRYVHPSMDIKRKYLDALSAFYDQIHRQANVRISNAHLSNNLISKSCPNPIHGQICGQES